MNVSRLIGVMLLLGGTVLTVSAAYAASVTLSSSNVMALGGTGQVTVNCPVGSSCTLSSFKWSIASSSSTAPTISGAQVVWNTASTLGTSSYTVYVTLYGTGSTVLTSGSATQAGSASQVTTSVPLSGSTTPSQVVSAEVDIVQTA